MYVDESKFDYFDKKRGITLWKSDELDMSAHLYYEPGQRLSLIHISEPTRP